MRCFKEGFNMTEKEKMISGKLYDSFLDGLFEDRQHAKDLIFEFNSLPPREVEKRNEKRFETSLWR